MAKNRVEKKCSTYFYILGHVVYAMPIWQIRQQHKEKKSRNTNKMLLCRQLMWQPWTDLTQSMTRPNLWVTAVCLSTRILPLCWDQFGCKLVYYVVLGPGKERFDAFCWIRWFVHLDQHKRLLRDDRSAFGLKGGTRWLLRGYHGQPRRYKRAFRQRRFNTASFGSSRWPCRVSTNPGEERSRPRQDRRPGTKRHPAGQEWGLQASLHHANSVQCHK